MKAVAIMLPGLLGACLTVLHLALGLPLASHSAQPSRFSSLQKDKLILVFHEQVRCRATIPVACEILVLMTWLRHQKVATCRMAICPHACMHSRPHYRGPTHTTFDACSSNSLVLVEEGARLTVG